MADTELGNYEVDNPELKKLLQEMAKKLTADLPKGYGFTLFLFGFGTAKPLFYISSARRGDMVMTVKEWLRNQGEVSIY